MSPKQKKFIVWAPRIIAIAFACFLALFSLDVFGVGYTFWQTVVAFLMHNIPVFVLAAVIAISWKYELVGAVVFALAGIAYMITAAINAPFPQSISWSITIAGPARFISALYFAGWKIKKN